MRRSLTVGATTRVRFGPAIVAVTVVPICSTFVGPASLREIIVLGIANGSSACRRRGLQRFVALLESGHSLLHSLVDHVVNVSFRVGFFGFFWPEARSGGEHVAALFFFGGSFAKVGDDIGVLLEYALSSIDQLCRPATNDGSVVGDV
ncbi:hypothetical protein FGB62_8g24 [Gracilaria domingensis]|nr:hypothetical protein FGB62_8g24 [Gracilaria domingensis]